MNVFALIPGMEGPSEVLLIFLAILLLFGGKKLPELARALGKSISEFKRGQNEPYQIVEENKKTKPAAPQGQPAEKSGNGAKKGDNE